MLRRPHGPRNQCFVERVGTLSDLLMRKIEDGLKLVLALEA
jgi:hypothetical protein